ncbi:MAG: sensor domain-containing diguanylate cyclase [Synechocystis sp.]|nr:sensor domain-containing diguanylate cyclase [Synechocystis sp.]
MLAAESFPDFDTAAHATLNFLHDRFGLKLWMVTRTDEEDWIVLQVNDQGYGVQQGDVFRWSDSFCSRMVKGEGPCIAPQANLVDVYRHAPIANQVPIGAYIGVPITYADGTLFGTLCAIDPDPQPEALAEELPLVQLLGKLLSTILDFFLKAEAAARREEHHKFLSERDVLTGLYNRRGWEQLLHSEEARCQQFGFPASVMMIDLDNLKLVNDQQGHDAGDELLKQAARLIKQTCRQQDICARIGGDEFMVLCIECHLSQADFIRERLAEVLQEAGIDASIGIAERSPSTGLSYAVKMADVTMYEQKRLRKSAR